MANVKSGKMDVTRSRRGGRHVEEGEGGHVRR